MKLIATSFLASFVLAGVMSAQPTASAQPAAGGGNVGVGMANFKSTLADPATRFVPQMAVKGAPSYATLPKRTRRYLVTKYGAIGDGKTVNTKAIQAAIDTCAATRQGGVVVVPKGTFLSGAIFLKQGVNLLVEKDGILKGTTNADDYPDITTRWEGVEETHISSFVNAESVTGLEISGEGTIDGSGEEWVQENPNLRQASGFSFAGPVPPVTPEQAARQKRGRPRLLGIQNAKEVRIAGLNLHNQAIWCLFVLYSQDVEIDGVTITAEHNIPSSDGIDIDSSKHVHINHAYIEDGDDCISIKSGRGPEALKINRPSEDILIENSHFGFGQGGVAMGSETSGGIRNVTTLNCLMDGGNWAPIRFKTQPSRGNVVENITYKDIVVHATRQAFEMNMEWNLRGGQQTPSDPPPVMRNITIVNVKGDVTSVGVIHGLASSPIDGVTFKDCKITAQRGFRLEHARNVDLSGLTADVKQGDAVTKTDVE